MQKLQGALDGLKSNLQSLVREDTTRMARLRSAMKIFSTEFMKKGRMKQVRADDGSAPHPKRSAAPSFRSLELSVGYVMKPSVLRTVSKRRAPHSPTRHMGMCPQLTLNDARFVLSCRTHRSRRC